MWWPVDTLYASGYLDLSDKPVILTIPNNAPIPPTSYSILMLDPYGDIFDAGIPRQPGIYGLTGLLPAEVTPIAMPLDFSGLIFRADKFSQLARTRLKRPRRSASHSRRRPLAIMSTTPPGER
jgi:hypothetical protein